MVTVSSIGLFDRLAVGPPSNWGLGYVDLTAGGGDFTQGQPPTGLVLGPWPASMQVPNLLCDPCTGPDASVYRYFAGTSQAAAQVSGAAALVVSQFGRKSWWRRREDGPRPRVRHPAPDGGSAALPGRRRPLCQEGNENGFFGNGVVNALRAVEHDKRDP